MTRNDETKIDPRSSVRPQPRSDAVASPPWWARIAARMRSGTFDRRLAVGAPVPPRSPLAAHVARLTSRAEREALAGTLIRMRREVDDDRAVLSGRLALHRPNIAAAEHLVDAVNLRLHSPLPVGVIGMARLRALLADGAGPLYRYGRGDLAGRLGAALAEL
jgi:hypothetical protein